MRILTLMLVGAAGTLGASTASAQYYGGWNNGNSYYQRAIYQTQVRCDRALRRADSRREYNYILQRCRQQMNSLERAYYQSSRNDWRYQDGRSWREDDRNWNDRRGRDRDDDQGEDDD